MEGAMSIVRSTNPAFFSFDWQDDDKESITEHMPPPPVEFQTAANSTETTSHMQATQSVHLTSRLNNFLKSLQSSTHHQASQATITPSSRHITSKQSDFNTIRNEFEMRSLAAAASPLTDQRLLPPQSTSAHIRFQPVNRMNQSCPAATTATAKTTTPANVDNDANQTSRFDATTNRQSCDNNTNLSTTYMHTSDTKQQRTTFKLDRLTDIDPMRLNTTSRFQCRVNDKLDENGTVWVEIIYTDNDETKFKELFKLLTLRSNLSHAPKYLYIGKYVSAAYKKQWQRAVIVDDLGQVDLSMIKVRYLDTGRIRFVDRVHDLREVDEKFFNAPNKSMHCTIRLDQRVRFTKEMREFFSCIVFKKQLNAKVLELCKENYRDLCKIELICEVPNGYVNIYAYLLSKFDRLAYEAYKVARKHDQNNKYKNSNNNTTTTLSSSTYTTESGVVSDTNDRFNNAVYSTDMYRLDTLNEQSIYSLDTNIDDYKDIEYRSYQRHHQYDADMKTDANNNNQDDDDDKYGDNVSMSVDDFDDGDQVMHYKFANGKVFVFVRLFSFANGDYL
jgi:hypothetical protein